MINFNKSIEFLDSLEFSKSDNFSPSTVFSYSFKFSRSNEFTMTGEFSEIQEFTKTCEFSVSKSFSDSKEFSFSEHFSRSNKFTFSGEFSRTGQFSNTGEFSKTCGFSKSVKFTESTSFSRSKMFSFYGYFSNSRKFSESELFSATDHFSVSNKFSQSLPYSESEFFSPSFSFNPSCIITANKINITLCRCSYEGEDEIVFVRIIKTNFTRYYNESDGGAIFIKNCGFECIGVNFTECVSLNGGGGAIYLINSRVFFFFKYNATISNSRFTRCEASYGGACYVYFNSDVNEVLFEKCVFEFNTYNNIIIIFINKHELFGGSSLFLSVKNGNLSFCNFYKNKGSSGVVKMFNKFDDENQMKTNSFSISDCDFVHEQEKLSIMIYYVSGNEANEVEISNCKFEGKLAHGSLFIEGKMLEKDKQKLRIKSCHFDNEDKNSIKIEMVSDFIQNEVNVDISSHFIILKKLFVFLYLICFRFLNSFIYIFKVKQSRQSRKI